MNIKKIIINFILIFGLINQYSLIASFPITIPSVKQWEETNGEFLFGSNSRIVIAPQFSSKLYNDCVTLQEDIYFLKGYVLPITSTDETKPGDIYLTLDGEYNLPGKEGYILDISDIVSISSVHQDGLFYGTRTLVQLLKLSDTLTCGKIRDWPEYPERGLMVDNGRKYFTISWLKNQIRDISYLKLNILHLHISDNEGFRLECSSNPEITSEQYYSKEEIKDLQQFAKKYHITIIPEIDMPGHSWAMLKNRIDETILKDSIGGYYGATFDITKDTTLSFITQILNEFIPLFDGPYWHMGTDEFISGDIGRYPQFLEFAQKKYGSEARHMDAYFGFINWVDSIVKSYGKTLRIWNDGYSNYVAETKMVKLNQDIIIEYWAGPDHPQMIIDRGYRVINCSSDFFYYVVGLCPRGEQTWLYEGWNPSIFNDVKTINRDTIMNLGCKYHIWCDIPEYETEEHIYVATQHIIRIMSNGIWGSVKIVPTYSEFEKVMKIIGKAPGVDFPANPMKNNLLWGMKVFCSGKLNDSIYRPEFANDGNYNTSWGIPRIDTVWIMIDLEDKYNINRVKLVWFGSSPSSYSVQLSNDSSNWSDLFKTNVTTPRIVDTTSLSGNGRYLRVLITGQDNSAGCNLWEIETYGSLLINRNNNDSVLEPSIIECIPNPFTDELKVQYEIVEFSEVKLDVTDILGKVIVKLFEGYQKKGRYTYQWNPISLNTGEYFIRLNMNGVMSVAKVQLIN